MVHNISRNNPLVAQFIAEIRDAEIQQDRMRFRRNIERIGEVTAIEIAKKMPKTIKEVTTSLGIAEMEVVAKQPVLATILRAGLPLHNGLLNYFDKGDCAFVSAYRKHHKSGEFTIKLEYLSCPDLEDRIIILSDPMLATGASMVITIKALLAQGTPKHIHVASVIACTTGIEEVKRSFSNITIWAGDIDDELTAKGYIVPGLGDAGDLAFGPKMQD